MIDKEEVYGPCVCVKIHMNGVRTVLNEQLDLYRRLQLVYDEDGDNGLPEDFYAGYLDAINVAISQLEDAYKEHILELEKLVNFTLPEKMGLKLKGESDG